MGRSRSIKIQFRSSMVTTDMIMENELCSKRGLVNNTSSMCDLSREEIDMESSTSVAGEKRSLGNGVFIRNLNLGIPDVKIDICSVT
ncbi:unnamed protein product [Trichobilharzia regenti]|nr:unnamed protein product [Trichobilharzia regenti]